LTTAIPRVEPLSKAIQEIPLNVSPKYPTTSQLYLSESLTSPQKSKGVLHFA